MRYKEKTMLELGVVFADIGALKVTELYRSYLGKQPKVLCVDIALGLPLLREYTFKTNETVTSFRRIWLKYPNPFKKNPLILLIIPSDQLVYVYEKSEVILKKASSIATKDNLLFCVTQELPPVLVSVHKTLPLNKTVEYAKIVVKEKHNYTINGILVHDKTD